MRKSAVKQESVNAACEQLSQDGQNVTVSGVIAVVGGSFTTVSPMIKQWKKIIQPVQVVELPDSVAEVMKRAVAEIWASASSLAKEEAEQIKADITQALAEAQTELGECVGEVARLELALSDAIKQLSEKESMLQAANIEVTRLTASEAALKARVADRDTNLKRARKDYAELKGQLLEIAKLKAKD